MIVSCIQPSYIPWRGYFHIIQKSDIFVFHEDIQYTKQDWRNRNKVKTSNGLQWVSVPVTKYRTETLINEVQIDNSQAWAEKHWNVIERAYRKTPCFEKYERCIRGIYEKKWDTLVELDIQITMMLCELLHIRDVEFVRSVNLGLEGRKTERLLQMCKKLGATKYLSGPAAQAYIEPEQFVTHGIDLEYMKYEYPEYPQMYGAFEPYVSVLDLLFNVGDAAGDYIWQNKTKG